MRVAIYARYSTDRQRRSSIDDQVRLCREYVETKNWTVVDVYADPEITGRSRHRPDFIRLVADAKAKKYDVVVTEAIDRLSRRQAHLHDLYDHLTFLDIDIFCPGLDKITQLHIAILGIVAEMYCKDTASKTKRSQVGLVEAGRIPGGLAYGYKVLPPTQDGAKSIAGEREIIDDRAVVIRRIFEEYANGISPENIALGLNSDAIPGPKGAPWRNTTIRGHSTRGTGILNNAIYIGWLIWNKTPFRADPDGKRQPRPNPPSEYRKIHLPHLRIVSDELWERVKSRQRQLAEAAAKKQAVASDKPGTDNNLNATHRAKYLLAGLLKCGACGSTYSIIGKDRYGCANHRRGTGLCSNSKTIIRQVVEERVLGCLRDKLLSPVQVDRFIKEFEANIRTTRRENDNDRRKAEKAVALADKAIAGLMETIESGNASGNALQMICKQLEMREVERTRAEETLSALIDQDKVVPLLPNAAELYRQKVAGLIDSLNKPEFKDEASTQLRDLIDHIVMTPAPEAPAGMWMDVYGDLAEILALGSGGSPKSKLPSLVGLGSQLSVVAGAGFEPATFRL